jgi:hypothetical protein
MKVFLQYLFTFFCFVPKTHSQNQEFIKYYEKINQAELFIVKKSYDSAIQIYSSVKDSLKAKEVYNYAICNLKIDEKNKAIILLQTLLEKGISKEWLMNDPFIQKKLSYADFQNINSSSIYSLGLKDTLNSIFETDQKCRRTPDPYKNNIQNIRKTDSINIVLLNKVIADYGDLPDEKLVGLDKESLVYQPYYIHIIHQSSGFKAFDYSTILLNAIKSGNINPQIGIHLYKRTTGKMEFCGPTGMFQIMYPNDSVTKENLYNNAFVEEYSKRNNWFVQRINDTQRQEIDSIRRQFGLESIADFEKKAIFQDRNREFRFYHLPFLRSFFMFDSKQEADILQKTFKELK